MLFARIIFILKFPDQFKQTKADILVIHLGKKQSLKVVKEDQSGYTLVCDQGQEVFMPGSLIKDKVAKGDLVEVFVYQDKDHNLLATGILPYAEVDDLVCLKVKVVSPHGAFMDLGLPKDLLVPRKLQQFEMHEGQVHLVKILIDPETKRLYGTSKVSSFVEKDLSELKPKQSVKIIPYYRTPLGYKVLIENKYLGMIFHNEIFTKVIPGKEYLGSIKTIHENGGRCSPSRVRA